MSFHISHNILQWILIGPNNQMNMIGHNYPAIYFKAFILLAIFPTIYQNFPVLISCENIYPVDNGIAYEIKLICI